MKIKTADQALLAGYCTEHSLKTRTDEGGITIFSTDVNAVLEIVSTFKDSIRDIEINKGTLNDVFIAITGKEIRN